MLLFSHLVVNLFAFMRLSQLQLFHCIRIDPHVVPDRPIDLLICTSLLIAITPNTTYKPEIVWSKLNFFCRSCWYKNFHGYVPQHSSLLEGDGKLLRVFCVVHTHTICDADDAALFAVCEVKCKAYNFSVFFRTLQKSLLYREF